MTAQATPRLPRIPWWALIVLSLSLCAFLASMFFRYETAIQTNGDTQAYERLAITVNAIRQGIPAEIPNYYPPLANIVFLAAGNNLFQLPFHQGLGMLFGVAFLTALSFIGCVLDPRRLRWVIIAVPGSIALLEPAVFFARFDFFPMLAVLVSVLSFERRQYALAGFLLALGCMMKLFPVFLIPLYLLSLKKPDRWHFVHGWIAGLAGALILCTWIIGLHTTLASIASFFTLRTGFPPYALSTASSIDLFVRMLAGGHGTIRWIEPDFGHFNTGIPVWVSSGLLLVMAAGCVGIAFATRRRAEHDTAIMLPAAATLLWVLGTTPLLTMHYYLWVLPLLLLWFLERTEDTWKIGFWQGVTGIGAVLVGLLGQWSYPRLYFDLVDHQTPLAVTVNAVRNLMVLVLVIACMRAMREGAKSRRNA